MNIYGGYYRYKNIVISSEKESIGYINKIIVREYKLEDPYLEFDKTTWNNYFLGEYEYTDNKHFTYNESKNVGVQHFLNISFTIKNSKTTVFAFELYIDNNYVPIKDDVSASD